MRGADFQDVRAFLQNGGQRGPQRQILREGTYAFNLAQFVVITEDQVYYLPMGKSEEETFQTMAPSSPSVAASRPVVIKGAEDAVGIVTVHDGPSLPQRRDHRPDRRRRSARAATYHNNFQDPEQFLAAGGFRGRQYQVLVEGTYFINRLFATVELIHKTVVEVGTVGVVVSLHRRQGRRPLGRRSTATASS